MHDQNFHEIQLSGKQLLFGFISAVVLLVVIFLLGVSVGRGVRTDAPQADAAASVGPAAPGDTVVPATPPAAVPQPGDLSYPQVLKGQPPAVATPPDQSPTDPAAKSASESAKATAESKAAELSPAPPAPPPAATGRPPAVDKKPPLPAEGVWFAQLGAYGTRRAADSVQKDVSSKGFDARVSPYGQLFRVRVGPFATEAEAERERARLAKAGFKSSVIR